MSMDATREDEKEAGKESTDENASLSNAALFRKLAILKLKLVGGYVLDGFAPVAAGAAVIVAVIAINGNKSVEAQMTQSAATIAALQANLLESKAELEKTKTILTQEKSRHEEKQIKQDEQTAQIIQGLSKLQQKMKIHPTLEEQMQQPAANLIAPPPTTTAAPSAAPVKAPAPAATPAVSTGTEKKPGSQTTILKEAIGKFNNK